ncbi:FAD-dependent oxidoreductase [Prauserella oleivorans]
MTDAYRPPGHVVVVGAGIVGLSTAHFLRRHDVAVTVLERRQVASGASWGNAGWLSPPSPFRCRSRRRCGPGCPGS